MTAGEFQYEYEKQRAGQLALGRLLTRATKAGLRPLTWTVSPSGVLVGKESGALHRTEIEKLFEAWAGFLGDGLVIEDDNVFSSTTDVTKNAYTQTAPGAGEGVTVRLRITVTSDWEQYL
ncbi:hypothetical protein [Streptomyces sp. NPDC127084]|uniref:hypothetical protein n=1 Tax=Streptomyces sp. NPDC127084 TaxID=3347133 RepID=UPI003657EF52